jgi:hypothetical protein
VTASGGDETATCLRFVDVVRSEADDRVSKARLIITVVVVEGRSQSSVNRRQGDAAFVPHSRRPHITAT